MDLMQLNWSAGLWVALGAAVGGIAARWRCRRQLHRLHHRIARLHAERDTLHGQIKQARLQVVAANQDLATRRHLTPAVPRHTAMAAPAAQSVATPPSVASLHQPIPIGLAYESSETPANGFADTLPFHHSNQQA